ncbi:hypothetical protein PF919_004838 [Salmonella enterica]|nr:hypothetical protein [Salmonella enterica subsp. enterica serovar Panama]EIL4619891.1 hypothetical protein [Salmonella enterica]EJC4647469.1 hypothetical protein [Salmonella enterica]EKI7237641.1 hypothetical protein [Salmonella enterica]EKQ9927203.1 hypothetical protein [Salmonella enterica subsp. enterica serovar Panama]
MGNRFDFEVAGRDAASEVLKQVSERVEELDSNLDKAREKLKLGGQPSQSAVDGLNTRFEKLSRHARDNVQYIGDMVPPLKNVTELVTRYGAVAMRLGAIGAAGYGISKGVQELNKAAKEAYDLNVAAKNAGLSVDDFTRISGAMQILGADADAANQSVEGLFKGLNDALQNRDSAQAGLLNQIGVHLDKTKDRTVDLKRALEDLMRIFPTLAPQTQKTLSDMLGFTEADLRLLREGAHYKELLEKSDRYGLTVDPDVNKSLTDVNEKINDLNARWEGFKNKVFQNAASMVFLGKPAGEAGKNMTPQMSAEMLDATSNAETGMTGNGPFGYLVDRQWKKLEQHKKLLAQANQLSSDISIITKPRAASLSVVPDIPYNEPVTKNTRGMRNNNPGNLTAAPNSPGKDGRFNIFHNQRDGTAALFRQLMLDADRGKPTLRQELKKYAPHNENPTEAYIAYVSRITGINPDAPLDLHDRKTLLRVVPPIIKFENGFQPFSPQQIDQGYQDAVSDPRWSGGRNGDFLQKQRDMLVADNTPPQQPDHQAMVQAVADGVTRGMSEAHLQVDMVNPYTGEHISVPARTGRVTTAMNQY